MNIKSQEINNFLVIELDNARIEATNSNIIKESINEIKLLEDKNVILNLNNIEFMDSSGIAVVISLYKKLVSNSKELRICNLNDFLKELFDITKLNQIMKIYDSLDDALK